MPTSPSATRIPATSRMGRSGRFFLRKGVQDRPGDGDLPRQAGPLSRRSAVWVGPGSWAHSCAAGRQLAPRVREPDLPEPASIRPSAGAVRPTCLPGMLIPRRSSGKPGARARRARLGWAGPSGRLADAWQPVSGFARMAADDPGATIVMIVSSHYAHEETTGHARFIQHPSRPVEPHLALRPAQAVGLDAQGRGSRARDRQARHPLREGRLPGRRVPARAHIMEACAKAVADGPRALRARARPARARRDRRGGHQARPPDGPRSPWSRWGPSTPSPSRC